jgi:putative SOS response-associated peptidase YedK
MCFEVSLRKKREEITNRLEIEAMLDAEYAPFFHMSGFTHNNLQIIPNHSPSTLVPAAWGLVPDWANHDPVVFLKKYNTLNAKSETVFESNTYKDSILENRCLIIVDGFFEPHHENGVSIPYFCYQPSDRFKDGSDIFAFAGIFSEIEEHKFTCSILTVPANPFFSEIHNKKKRMPLVLDEHYFEDWLDDINKSQINELIATAFTDRPFKAHPVSRDLYKRGIDTNKPYIVEPVDKETLF